MMKSHYPHHTRQQRSFRFVPRVEDLERRESPSLFLTDPIGWNERPVTPTAAAADLRLVPQPVEEEQCDSLFSLVLGWSAEQPDAAPTEQPVRAATPITPTSATLLDDPFAAAPSASRHLTIRASLQESPTAAQGAGVSGAELQQGAPPTTTGNNLFVTPAPVGGAESLWAVVNAGNNTPSGPGTQGEFTESLYASGGNLSGITGIAWAPDGGNRLFVLRKTGEVMIIQNGVVQPTPFATIRPIITSSECGLIGIAFDPDYLSNGYIYFFVSVAVNDQQIIRYTDAGNVGVDKTTIIAGLPTRGANHDGGAVGFGIDGKLYWAVGDLGNFTGVNEDLTTLAAKVGRANRDGSVPGDNPFDDGPGPNNDYIWSIGWRNPFTFTFQPWTNELWVNSVGTSYEQVFRVTAGSHAGYNRYENNQPAGFLEPVIKYRTNGTDTRNILANGAVRQDGVTTFTHAANNLLFRRGERIAVTGVADASFNGDYYILDTPTATTFRVLSAGPNATSGGGSAVTQNQGGCLTGGVFYDATAFPSEYHGNFFYGDCNSGRVLRATLDGENNVTSVDYFRRPLTNSYIDAAVGPDGALYYGYNGGQIFRLSYNQVQQHLIISPQYVTLDENGQAVFNVSLAMPPAANVVVDVAYELGDTDIVPSWTTQLTFTPANWSTPQPVYLYAYPDKDADLDYTWFSVNAKGLPTEFVLAVARDG